MHLHFPNQSASSIKQLHCQIFSAASLWQYLSNYHLSEKIQKASAQSSKETSWTQKMQNYLNKLENIQLAWTTCILLPSFWQAQFFMRAFSQQPWPCKTTAASPILQLLYSDYYIGTLHSNTSLELFFKYILKLTLLINSITKVGTKFGLVSTPFWR